MSEGLGCFRFARRYSGNHDCFLFLGLLRCFTSPRWLDTAYEFSGTYCGMTRSGLPHSDIAGSKAASASPTLFAGNHVLHRLLVPRHPPYALNNFSEILIDTRSPAPHDGAEVHRYNIGRRNNNGSRASDGSIVCSLHPRAEQLLDVLVRRRQTDCQRTNR
jgi:hypothetical protein